MERFAIFLTICEGYNEGFFLYCHFNFFFFWLILSASLDLYLDVSVRLYVSFSVFELVNDR